MAQRYDIVSRLTDPVYYTGTHKHRFDLDTGRGRGLDGRDEAAKGIGHSSTTHRAGAPVRDISQIVRSELNSPRQQQQQQRGRGRGRGQGRGQRGDARRSPDTRPPFRYSRALDDELTQEQSARSLHSPDRRSRSAWERSSSATGSQHGHDHDYDPSPRLVQRHHGLSPPRGRASTPRGVGRTGRAHPHHPAARGARAGQRSPSARVVRHEVAGADDHGARGLSPQRRQQRPVVAREVVVHSPPRRTLSPQPGRAYRTAAVAAAAAAAEQPPPTYAVRGEQVLLSASWLTDAEPYSASLFHPAAPMDLHLTQWGGAATAPEPAPRSQADLVEVEGGLVDREHNRTEWATADDAAGWHVAATHSGDLRTLGRGGKTIGWQQLTIHLEEVASNVHSIFLAVSTREGASVQTISTGQLKLAVCGPSGEERVPIALPTEAEGSTETDLAILARLVRRPGGGGAAGWAVQPLGVAAPPEVAAAPASSALRGVGESLARRHERLSLTVAELLREEREEAGQAKERRRQQRQDWEEEEEEDDRGAFAAAGTSPREQARRAELLARLQAEEEEAIRATLSEEEEASRRLQEWRRQERQRVQRAGGPVPRQQGRQQQQQQRRRQRQQPLPHQRRHTGGTDGGHDRRVLSSPLLRQV
jgi:hypothetical protein